MHSYSRDTTLAEAERANITGLRAFVTPTIAHFGAVLALAAFMCVPRQTARSISLGVGGLGLAGLVYIGLVASYICHSLGTYIPVREDWIFNVIVPCLAYASLIGAAFLIRRHPDPGLNGVAAASMILLFIGIHNAWDIAVWMTLNKPDASTNDGSDKKQSP